MSHPTDNIYLFHKWQSMCFIPINLVEPAIFAIFNIWKNSVLLINQNSADSRWAARICVYSLKGNVQTSASDE